MKIAIVCVNYNSYDSLDNFLSSLDQACKIAERIEVHVFVADNSDNKQKINTDCFNHLKFTIKPCDNLGYLGGAFKMINEMDNRSIYEYVIISNVDVKVNEDFFSRLSAINSSGLGWIAPGIFKPQMHKICSFEKQSRPSVNKMKLYSFLFAHPTLYSFYFILSRLKIKTKENTDMTPRPIYAGYGSFMIFTREFMSLREEWNYEPFLFGEELFFGELNKRANLMVLYIPSLQITDVGKVSTGRMNALSKLKVQKVSNDYLLKTFFLQ